MSVGPRNAAGIEIGTRCANCGTPNNPFEKRAVGWKACCADYLCVECHACPPGPHEEIHFYNDHEVEIETRRQKQKLMALYWKKHGGRPHYLNRSAETEKNNG